jgi:ADP-ribosylglycohydrolase
VLVGDALGVPVEFTGRSMRDRDPVTDMRGYGTWNQPAGTWSDDSSMTLATADVLVRMGWDLPAMLHGFLGWLDHNEWTPHGAVFDIGNATRNALMLFRIGGDHTTCGQPGERDNGNGSLMRCLPVSLWLFGSPAEHLREKAGDASALTHAHLRSRLCCAWHALWCDAVLSGRDIRAAAQQASKRLRPLITVDLERQILKRLLDGSVMDLPRASLQSDGYVVSTLEASLWCVANHADFRSTVLAAVNLGGDADTTGAVAGGMAGLVYGLSGIPTEWIDALARRAEVMALAERFADACLAQWAQAG